MNDVIIKRSDDYLAHHGVKGMKWGVRHDPERVGHTGRVKNASSKRKKHKGLSDRAKRRIMVGAALVGTALAAYGAYKLGKSGVLSDLIHLGKDKMGKLSFPKDAGGVANPNGYTNNCKDVAEATLKRWLGVDASAVAGPKSVTGNLHTFVESRGYNPKGLKWFGETGSITSDPSGDSTSRVTKQILRKYKEGDCGMLNIVWDSDKVQRLGSEDSHAFNWFIQNGSVRFIDDQPEQMVTDASRYLKYVKPNKEIEIVQIMKEAFDR